MTNPQSDALLCPGCGKDMSNADPVVTLGNTYFHELLCAPPGLLDVLMALEGHYTSTFSRWVGRQIEAMVRDDVKVV